MFRRTDYFYKLKFIVYNKFTRLYFGRSENASTRTSGRISGAVAVASVVDRRIFCQLRSGPLLQLCGDFRRTFSTVELSNVRETRIVRHSFVSHGPRGLSLGLFLKTLLPFEHRSRRVVDAPTRGAYARTRCTHVLFDARAVVAGRAWARTYHVRTPIRHTSKTVLQYSKRVARRSSSQQQTGCKIIHVRVRTARIRRPSRKRWPTFPFHCRCCCCGARAVSADFAARTYKCAHGYLRTRTQTGCVVAVVSESYF